MCVSCGREDDSYFHRMACVRDAGFLETALWNLRAAIDRKLYRFRDHS